MCWPLVVCTTTQDLLIIVDASSSISLSDWDNYILTYLRLLVRNMDIDGGRVRIALSLYSSSGRKDVTYFDEHTRASDVSFYTGKTCM